MTTGKTARAATRAELLEELGQYVSAGAVADAAELSTDEQIAARIESCRAQLEWYRSCGFEDAAAQR